MKSFESWLLSMHLSSLSVLMLVLEYSDAARMIDPVPTDDKMRACTDTINPFRSVSLCVSPPFSRRLRITTLITLDPE